MRVRQRGHPEPLLPGRGVEEAGTLLRIPAATRPHLGRKRATHRVRLRQLRAEERIRSALLHRYDHLS